MDWLSQRRDFAGAHLDRFQFKPSSTFVIRTVAVNMKWVNPVEIKTLNSAPEYRTWIDKCQEYTQAREPMVLLVMHQRLQGDCKNTVSLPYDREMMQDACRHMFQHWSLALLMPRTSNAIFNSRSVTWDHDPPMGPSTVFNCRSDTESPTKDDNVLMSVTCFTRIPLTFSVMYGCTKDIMDQVEMWLRQFKRSAFHPFMFPMIFAEIERKRLLTPLRNSNTKNLKARVEELENRLRNEGRWNRSSGSEKNDARLTLMQRDCEDTKAWDSVNKIKNGIESLIVVLESMDKSMDKELKTVCGGDPILGVGTTEEQQKQAKRTELIQARLAEIIFELQCKVRDCKGLLGGMALATQMEWNYHARRDAKINRYIAFESKRDSAQMKYISKMGMIFLPGTFLATLFSMGFFKWIPDDSNAMISPYLALYVGLTTFLTCCTVWRWGRWISDEEDRAIKQAKLVIDSESDEPLLGSEADAYSPV